MPQPIGFSYAHTQSLSTTFVGVACLSDAANEPNSKPFPRKGRISHIEIEIESSASSPATVDAYLTWDAAGNRIATPATTQTITPGTGTSGGVVYSVGVEYDRPDDAVAGSIYVWARVNTGTATAHTRVYWRR